MRVNETFMSIQGEGPLTGSWSYFLRLHGCNLSCEFCDTKYSWKYYLDIPVLNVATSIERSKTKFLVITGGEPTLQLMDVYDLLDTLESIGRKPFVTLETNGTKRVDADKFDLIMVSPKDFADSTLWWDVDNAYLKFVVDESNIDDTIEHVLSSGTSKPVYFMPQSHDMDEMMTNSYLIMYKIEEHGLHNILLCPRLQLLYGVK